MPTAYLKKLAKLNNTSVDKLEKFWSQAKEIAKSEGQGKSWGLITTIFQNKLKKEGFRVKAYFTLGSIEDREEISENLGAIKFLKLYKNMKFTPATYLFGLLVGYASLSTTSIKVKDLKEQSYDVFGDDSVLKKCKTVEDVLEVCKKEFPKYVRKFNSFISKYSSKYIYRADDCHKDDLDINKLGVCWTTSKGFIYHYAINLTEPTITCALFDYNNIDWILTTAISITTEGEMVNEIRIKNPQKLKIVNIKEITVDSLYEKVFKFVDILEKYYGVQLSKNSVPRTSQLLEKYTGWGFWKVKDFVFNHGNNVSLFIKKAPKKPSNCEVDAFTSLADTDELDDADLGINVDPKEYHKQKSKQLSLVNKLKNSLNSIKTQLNTESKKYIRDLKRHAEELENNYMSTYAGEGKENLNKYLNYKAHNLSISKDSDLFKAFLDGINLCYINNTQKLTLNDKYKLFCKTYKRVMSLYKSNKIILYRGLCILCDEYTDIEEELKHLKYNLLDRNSWTTDLNVARAYSKSVLDIGAYPDTVFLCVVLKIEASKEDINLPMTFFLEGRFYYTKDKEINLRKSLQIKNISILEMKFDKYVPENDDFDDDNDINKFSEYPSSSIMIGFIKWALHNGKQSMIKVAKAFENLTGYRCKDIANKFREFPSVISKNKKLIESLDKISKTELAKLGKEIGIGNEIEDYVVKCTGASKQYTLLTADTDELDDADLGINVDPKEYHKQKSLQMSLQSKLDMIKKDLNKEADDYNKELVSIAKKLNEENRKRYSQDNHGDKWLNYKGKVTKEVLLEAFKDGVKCGYEGFGTISSDDDIRDELNYYKNSIYPRFAKLLKGSSLRVYRGLDFFDLISKDKEHELNKYLKYLKYNLMDRNSWSTSIETAKRYINYKFAGIILRMNCTLEDANLPLSAWLEGYWYENGGNEEINLKKSFKVKDIKCVFVGSSLEKLFDMNKFNSNKTLAFYEPDSLDSTNENKLDYIGQVKECIKQIWARGINQEQTAKEWSNNYGNLISDCFYKDIEPKVCARMCYIKYHKENPYTKHLNKDNDVSFDKLLSEANTYFNHLKELKKNNSIITSSTKSFDKVGSDGTKYSFEKLTSAKDVVELLKGINIIDDYFNENDEYFKRRYGVSKKEATLGDVGWDEDIIIYIKYNNGKEWYSVDTESKLNDLKLSGIKDAIFEWNGGSVTSYYGDDCRIEKYDEDEDSPWVVKCSKGEIMSKFNKVTSKYNVYLYNGRVVTASNKYELLRENANTKKLMDKIKEDTWDDIEV